MAIIGSLGGKENGAAIRRNTAVRRKMFQGKCVEFSVGSLLESQISIKPAQEQHFLM